MAIRIGLDQTAGRSGALGNGTAPVTFWLPFVASASGLIDHLNVDLNNNSNPGGNVTLAIYDSTGTTLLGHTNSATIVFAPLSIPLVASVSVTAGTTYILACMTSTTSPQINTDSTSSSDIQITNGVNTFGTWPASLVDNDDSGGKGVIALWGTGADSGSVPGPGPMSGGFRGLSGGFRG